MKYLIIIFSMLSLISSSYANLPGDYKQEYIREHEVRSHQRSGSRTALYLTTDCNNTADSCGHSGVPAFLCSGAMLRGVISSPDDHSWDPSPASIQRGGISFSYLRYDQNDFYTQANITIQIIEITLPQAAGDNTALTSNDSI